MVVVVVVMVVVMMVVMCGADDITLYCMTGVFLMVSILIMNAYGSV